MTMMMMITITVSLQMINNNNNNNNRVPLCTLLLPLWMDGGPGRESDA